MFALRCISKQYIWLMKFVLDQTWHTNGISRTTIEFMQTPQQHELSYPGPSSLVWISAPFEQQGERRYGQGQPARENLCQHHLSLKNKNRSKQKGEAKRTK
jgi:hypothetical protein